MSSLAGETLAMVATIGETVYAKAILVEIFGRRVEDVPELIKNLYIFLEPDLERLDGVNVTILMFYIIFFRSRGFVII